MEPKFIFGIVPLLLSVASYGIYIHSILNGKTKPHAFSWIIWTLLAGTVYFVELNNGAGLATLVTASVAVMGFVVFCLALYLGDKEFTLIDWICLFIALVAIATQYMALSAVYAIELASLAYIIGFIPTVRKAYKKPYEEKAITYSLNSAKFFISIVAISVFAPTTLLYPVVLGVGNFAFVCFLIDRRHKVKKPRKRTAKKRVTRVRLA